MGLCAACSRVFVEKLLSPDWAPAILAWPRRLGEATYRAMLAIAEESVAAGASLVVEANFVRGGDFEARLAALPAHFVQVHCSAPLEVLLERYAERHPGHVDAERMEALRDAVETGKHEPLELSGETIRIDTSTPLDLPAIVEHILDR